MEWPPCQLEKYPNRACPCLECAGKRAQASRAAQGLPPGPTAEQMLKTAIILRGVRVPEVRGPVPAGRGGSGRGSTRGTAPGPLPGAAEPTVTGGDAA